MMVALRAIFLLLVVVGLVGCQGARVGVGMPRALLYQNTTVPFTVKRDRGPGPTQPLVIPPNVSKGESTFYGISINIPGLTSAFFIPVPTLDPFSVGWGDGSLEKAMEQGDIGEVLYGDADHLVILNGLWTRVRVRVYGLKTADMPPPGPPGGGPPGSGPPPGATGQPSAEAAPTTR
jgi:hypothetical protein